LIDDEITLSVDFGPHLARLDQKTKKVGLREKKAVSTEKKLDRDLQDLIEYTKWMTGECSGLKKRVRTAEKVITDLRTSGEESVDQLMERLYSLKNAAEEREAQAEEMRTVITDKEQEIKMKEGLKSQIKQDIEVENADRENKIAQLRS